MPWSRRSIRRPDARTHQHGGRVDAAERHDDLAATKLDVRAGNVCLHADRPVAIEQQLRHERPIGDGQIAARAHRRIEIADRRGRPLVRPVAHRHRAIAVAEVAVHVGDEGNLPLLRIVMHRARQRRPIRDRRTPDRDQPVAAVQIAAGEIEVLFEFAKERQHIVPAPAGGAQRLPFVVVVGRSAQRHHAHHGGAAAHDAPLRKPDLGRVVAQTPMHLQRPHIGVVVVGDRIGVAHVGGQIVRRRVPPGFEQQHAAVRRRGQPVGQHAAGRAATDDNGVATLGTRVHCNISAARYCVFIPEALTTLPHFSISPAKILPNTSGEPGSGSPPVSVRRARIFASA